jgi:hypothetical protein
MPDDPKIPIFPLDNVVLFPRVQVPLYIFELRYRQLTADAIAGEGRIGMVVVLPGHRDEMSGDPPVFPVGCAGEIGQAQAHADGTYHVVLQGLHRFRVREELPRQGDRLYRIARIEPLDDPAPEQRSDLAGTRDRVLELMRLMLPDRADRFVAEAFEQIDDATFIDAFCQSLEFSTLEKQQLLEANGVRTRAEQLLSLMEFRIAERGATRQPGSGTVH